MVFRYLVLKVWYNKGAIMKLPKLSEKTKIFIADKLMDSANYVLVGLVIGDLVTGKIRLAFFTVGLLIYIASWTVSINLENRR